MYFSSYIPQKCLKNTSKSKKKSSWRSSSYTVIRIYLYLCPSSPILSHSVNDSATISLQYTVRRFRLFYPAKYLYNNINIVFNRNPQPPCKHAAVSLCIQTMMREYETKTICSSGHVIIIKK